MTDYRIGFDDLPDYLLLFPRWHGAVELAPLSIRWADLMPLPMQHLTRCKPTQSSSQSATSTAPHPLVICAWLWLAAETDDPDEKRRCLEAVLNLNPDHQAAHALLALLHQRQIKDLDIASIANNGCQC